MNLSELARGIKPFVQRWIDGALLGGDRDLGTVGNPYNTLYADTVTAGTIVGTMTGGEWETTGNATIDANQASATTVVYVVNQASGGTANLDVEGSIVVGGTVDGVDVSAHAANANAHHNQSHVLATTSGLGPDHTVIGLTSGQVLPWAAKHSAKGTPDSNSRKTAPIEMSAGARASCKPPLRPRWVATKPLTCSWLMTCARWLPEALQTSAMSAERRVRPTLTAQHIRTRAARLVRMVRRMERVRGRENPVENTPNIHARI